MGQATEGRWPVVQPEDLRNNTEGPWRPTHTTHVLRGQ